MIDYIVNHSRKKFVNHFANYIVKKLDPDNKYNSRIKVTEHKSFLVIEGVTTVETYLNINEIKQSYIKENKDFLSFLDVYNFNLIDIIRYEKLIEKPTIFNHVFYNSKRPLYHHKIIELVENDYDFLNYVDSISYNNRIVLHTNKEIELGDYFILNENTPISSSFPNGYSKNMGIIELLYSEHIAYHLFDFLNTNEILIKLNYINEEKNYKISVVSDSIYNNIDIESLIMDVFDFDLLLFEKKYMMDYDSNSELSTPLSNKPWIVKDKMKDLILI